MDIDKRLIDATLKQLLCFPDELESVDGDVSVFPSGQITVELASPRANEVAGNLCARLSVLPTALFVEHVGDRVRFTFAGEPPVAQLYASAATAFDQLVAA